MKLTKIVSIATAVVLSVCSVFSAPLVAKAATNEAFGVTASFKNPDGDTNNVYEKASAVLYVCNGEAVEFGDRIKGMVDVFVPSTMLATEGSSVNLHLETIVNSGPGFAPVPVGIFILGDYEVKNDGGKIVAINIGSNTKTGITSKKVGDYIKISIKTDENDTMFIAAKDGSFIPNQTYVADPENHCDQITVTILGNKTNQTATVYIDNLKLISGKTTIFETDFSSMSEYTWLEYRVNDGSTVTDNVKAVAFNQNLLKLSKSSATIKKGGKVTIKATATPKAKVTYKSANTKIAKVTNKGVVTGVKAGSTTIRVTANGVTKSFKVTVK